MDENDDLFKPPKSVKDILENKANGGQPDFSNPNSSAIPDFTKRGDSPIKRKMTQGDKYNGDAGSKNVDKEVINKKEAKPINKKVIMFGCGILACIGLVAGIVWYFNGKGEESSQVADQESSSEVPSFEDNDLSEFEFKYSDEQVEQLREVGYTGDEIEEYQKSQSDFDTLIKEAEEKRKEWANKELKPIYDGRSEAYKKLESKTWLGQKERKKDVKKFNKDTSYTQYDAIKNFDYEKIEPRGVQLFLKVYTDGAKHKNYMFINVSPQRYNELKEKGNIIIKYTYIVETWVDDGYTKENKKNMWITKAEEYVDSTIDSDTGADIGNINSSSDYSNSDTADTPSGGGGFEGDGF